MLCPSLAEQQVEYFQWVTLPYDEGTAALS
jgi:hypothetical protein